jgi:hypothetical protein
MDDVTGLQMEQAIIEMELKNSLGVQAARWTIVLGTTMGTMMVMTLLEKWDRMSR